MKNKILLSTLALFLLLILTLSISSCIKSGTFNPTNSISTNTNNSVNNNDIEKPDNTVTNDPIDYTNTFYLVDALFKSFSIFDVDYETAMLTAIQAYVSATGDRYALFYTPEEFKALNTEDSGNFYGIGVKVIFNYDEHFIEIVSIMPDSPALDNLQVGDKITHIVINDEKIDLKTVVADYIDKIKKIYPTLTNEEINILAGNETLNYATSNLKGPEGTFTEFVIDRNGTSIDMKLQRTKVKSISVTAKTSIKDPTVGIVTISQFDLTTPVQFKECMNALIEKGCDKFVFDLRNNPGGAVASVVAILSTLMEKNDVIITTKDTQGYVNTVRVELINYGLTSDYATYNVTSADIGKYSGYEMVVLTDENTASSAEIFTATLRDHNLATIVGKTTYGKGSIQTVFDLSGYGSEYFGGLRLTTKLYFPPSGIGFDGVGIEPDYEVGLEGIAAETHFYKLTEEIDNQLQKAVSVLID